MIQGGFFGKILRVNLSDGSIATSTLPEDFATDYLGGRGIGARILYQENPPHVDAFSSDNRLIFFTGPMMGTTAPCCVKFSLVTKSPLSGTILMSLAGGYFGPEFKRAGYDGMVIQGEAKEPVTIRIVDDRVEIVSAAHLWGKETIVTQEDLRSSLGSGDAKTLCIGPAGENLVRFAGVFSGTHALGRGGGGAVMGSKNLKAIVVKGAKGVPLADKKAFDEYIKGVILPKFKDSERVKSFGQYGTPGVFSIVNSFGILPTRNYRQGTFEDAEAIDGQAVKDARPRPDDVFLEPGDVTADDL